MRARYSFSSRHTGYARDPKNYLKQRQKYPVLLQKILDQAEIILEVLDARFVDETRNKEIEEDIVKRKKQIIYVINKSDLKPKQAILPEPYAIVSAKDRVGIRDLRDRIKILAKKAKPDKDGKVIVGVIGYPNTGKSSLINVLTGKGSAPVGSEAGFTKGLQKLRLSAEITLLDSPGVIPQKEYSSQDVKLHSKNTIVGARSHSQVSNPEQVIAELMINFPNTFDTYYKTSSNNDSEALLEELGRRKHFLLKGNQIDTDKTARLIIKEWQEGKISVDEHISSARKEKK